jgi:Flp pilus assembly protein TadD
MKRSQLRVMVEVLVVCCCTAGHANGASNHTEDEAAKIDSELKTLEELIVSRHFDEATAQLAKLQNQAAYGQRARILSIRLAILKRDYKQAIQLADDALQTQPLDSECHLLRGIACCGLRRDREEWQAILQAYTLAPTAPRIRIYRAVNFYTAGLHSKALAELDDVIHLNPRIQRAYRSRASVHSAMGNFNHALNDLNAARRLEPTDIDLIAVESSICGAQGQLQVAYDLASKPIEEEPHYFAHYLRRAHIAELLNKPALAKEDYDRAVELADGNGTPYFNRLIFNCRQFGIAPADKQELFDKDLAILLADPDFRTRALRFRARQHFERNALHEALLDMAEYSWLECENGLPELVEAIFDPLPQLSEIQFSQPSLLPKVREVLLARQEESDPKHIRDGSLIVVYRWQSKHDDALKLAREIAEHAPADAKVKYCIAELLLRSGETDKAATVLATIENKETDSATLLFEAEIALFGRGELRQAVRLTDRAIDLDPSNARAAFLRQDLLQLLGQNKDAFAELYRATVLSVYDRYSSGSIGRARYRQLESDAIKNSPAFKQTHALAKQQWELKNGKEENQLPRKFKPAQ